LNLIEANLFIQPLQEILGVVLCAAQSHIPDSPGCRTADDGNVVMASPKGFLING